MLVIGLAGAKPSHDIEHSCTNVVSEIVHASVFFSVQSPLPALKIRQTHSKGYPTKTLPRSLSPMRLLECMKHPMMVSQRKHLDQISLLRLFCHGLYRVGHQYRGVMRESYCSNVGGLSLQAENRTA